MATKETRYTWDDGEKRFRDRFGRFVARSDVRGSLDEYLDRLTDEVRNHSVALQDGRIGISEWQERMEASIKRGHTTATAIAKGGWKQATASDWGKAGQTIQFHYSKLRRFAMELESDTYTLDGRFLNRAEMYALGPTSTYERLLREGDIDAGYRWEKRILHSSNSCDACRRYYDMDWQPIGVLPNIGQECECLTRCRCTFQRSKNELMPKRRGQKMSIEGFDNDKCDRRRSVAAQRDHVDAFPMRFMLGHKEMSMDGTGFRLLRSYGEIPADDPSALATINGRRKQLGEARLELGDIYIHYMEAANSNHVGDRSLNLDASSLRKFADMSNSGIAFMNSHKTGGLSSPAELPYGRSFAGRYEEFAKGDETFKRTLMGIYMVKGQYPNGPLAPSTDQLHAGIESGTIADVSVGLNHEGNYLCDVCGADVESGDCQHVPGTTFGMTDDEKEEQRARGIPGGKASYTAYNVGLREVSAVYKGAVPGAGFRKSLQFMNQPAFVSKHGPEVLATYGPMLKRRQVHKLEGKKQMDWAKFLSYLKATGELSDSDLATVPGTAVPPAVVKNAAPKSPSDDPEIKAERERLAAESAKLAAQKRDLAIRQYTADADKFVGDLKTASKATPFELNAIKVGYVVAAMDDEFGPKLDFGDAFKIESRLQTFKDSHSQRAVTDLKTEKVGDAELPSSLLKDGEKAVGGVADPNPNPEHVSAERLAELCNTTDEGRVAFAALAAMAAKMQGK